MNVILCDPSWEARWNAFIDARPDASFYHRYGWLRVNARAFGHRTFALGAVDDGALVGILPIVQLKSPLFGNLACSMPFVNFGGVVADSPAAEVELLAAAEALLAREGFKYIEIRSRRPAARDLPTSTRKISMTIDLAPGAEALWNAFKTGHRQEIRRAYKHGLSARTGGPELLDAFHAILAECWRDLGTPFYRRSYFQMIFDEFPEAMRITMVFAGSTPVAAEMSAFHNGVVEGMWLGTLAAYRRQMAGYVLYWEAIKHACESGLTRYHLGRSTADSNAETFKKKWNATPTQLYWQYLMPAGAVMPELNPDSPKYRMAIDTWRRLPVSVTRMIGPSLARCIP
jgi:FemAB-related protein (PEP-CTERM system-associated)